MDVLSKLTPSETHLIRENSNASFKDLLKFTLIDLILKKALKSEEHEHQSHPSNPVRLINYISPGAKFESYSYRPHELVFLEPFLKSRDLEIMFRHLVKMGYENARNRRKFIFDDLYHNEMVKRCIHNNLFYRYVGPISLTAEGNKAKSLIDKDIESLEKKLPDLIENDPKAALEILNRITGNIFLLKSFDFELLRKIDDELTKEIAKRSDDGTSGCGGCFVFIDSYSDAFDGGFDSADGSDGGGGCGGDAGCSGCSGCGGCGGCS